MELVETGIPQGSPISPILFLFFNAPLIEECKKLKLPIQVSGFVDDVHLLAYSRSTKRNCEVLDMAHEVCLRWAKTYRASFTPKKYELVYITRRIKGVKIDATVKLEGIEVKLKTSIRVLGLMLDSKLNWNAHLRKVQAKIDNQIQALHYVAGSI